jgi:hypothetical protein
MKLVSSLAALSPGAMLMTQAAHAAPDAGTDPRIYQFRADADLHFELHARVKCGETSERRRQRAAGNLLYRAEPRRA